MLSRYHSEGASGRVRFYQYIPYLREHGFDIKIAPLFYNGYVSSLFTKKRNPGRILCDYIKRVIEILRSRSFDFLWIQGELLPKMPAILERTLNAAGINYIVDYDDAIFSYYEDSKNPVFSKLLRNKIDVVMKNAVLVIAGNDYLARRAIDAGAKHVKILPSVIDLNNYPAPATQPQDKNTFTIGWTGTPITAKFLHYLSPVFEEISKDKNIKIKLVGSGAISLGKAIPEIAEWSLKTEVSEMQSFDVGIMPLDNHPFSLGKCGYKIIQYFACGKPVVASPVGVNKKIVRNGENGFLASTPEEWSKAFSVMRDNHKMTLKMGIAGRKLVEKEYCLQVTAPKLLSFFNELKTAKYSAK